LHTFSIIRKLSLQRLDSLSHASFLSECLSRGVVPNNLNVHCTINLDNTERAKETHCKINEVLHQCSSEITKIVKEHYEQRSGILENQIQSDLQLMHLSTNQKNKLSQTLQLRETRNLSKKAKKLNMLCDQKVLVSSHHEGPPEHNGLLPFSNDAIEHAPNEKEGVFHSQPVHNTPIPVQGTPDKHTTRFVNFSSRILTKDETNLLNKGMSFCPTQKNFSKRELMRDFQKLGRALRLRERHFGSNGGTSRDNESCRQFTQLETLTKMKRPLDMPTTTSSVLNQYIKAVEKNVQRDLQKLPKNNAKSNLSAGEQRALKALSSDQSVVIKPVDKGGLICILDKSDYVERVDALLCDTSVYRPISESDAKAIVGNISAGLTDLVDFIDPRVIQFMNNKNAVWGRFYGLVKLHKSGMPLRPIVSANSTHTENIAAVVDVLIKELPLRLNSYIKDTNHFLEILSSTIIPETANVILATLDVTSLYTNIPHSDGIRATAMFYEKVYQEDPQAVPTDVVCRLLKMVLENNIFEFNNQLFLQISGTSMGAVMAPSYANLFMGELEEKFIESFAAQYAVRPLVYIRYIDDIFIVWTNGEELLHRFIEEINQCHVSIKFTHSVSTSSVHFLDVTVSLQPGNQLTTSLYVKPTDNPSYLHWMSEHPRHMKVSIPYSMALRCRRICSETATAKNEIGKLRNKFLSRGYPAKLLDDAAKKALSKKKTESAAIRRKPTVNLITTFNSNLPNFKAILKKHFPILQSDERTREIFDSCPGVVYKRPRNIRDYVVHSKVGLSSVTDRNFTRPAGSQPCRKPRCKVCQHMRVTEKISSMDNSYSFTIRGNYDCQTANCVYLMQCMKCKQQYIGETSTPFNIRFNNHKAHRRTIPTLGVSKHCSIPGHDIMQFKTVILKSGFSSAEDRLFFESYLIQNFKTKSLGMNDNCGVLPHLLPE
jgi:hypothetical protein